MVNAWLERAADTASSWSTVNALTYAQTARISSKEFVTPINARTDTIPTATGDASGPGFMSAVRVNTTTKVTVSQTARLVCMVIPIVSSVWTALRTASRVSVGLSVSAVQPTTPTWGVFATSAAAQSAMFLWAPRA